METHLSQPLSTLSEVDIIFTHNKTEILSKLFLSADNLTILSKNKNETLTVIKRKEIIGGLYDAKSKNLDILLASEYLKTKCCCSSSRSLRLVYFPVKMLSDESGINTQNAIHNIIRTHHHHTNPVDLKNIYNFEKRNFLICVNPRSGKGEAPEIFQKYKKAFDLISCGGQIDLLRTQRPQHLMDILREMTLEKLNSYKAIITISGDGLPHEALNGLMSRPDFHLVTTALFPLPGGSGNAWVQNILHQSERENSIENMLYILSRERKHKHDIVRYQIDEKKTVFGFLNFCYGFFGDLDIESEFLRCMGSTRFDVYGAWRWVVLRNYRARLAYAYNNVINEEKDILEEKKAGEEKQSKEWDFDQNIDLYFMSTNNIPFITADFNAAPLAAHDDGFMDLVYIGSTKKTRMNLLRYLLSQNERSLVTNGQHTRYDYHKVKRFLIDTKNATRYSFFDIDGERYDGRKAEANVLEKIITVFSLKEDPNF